jgi:hypothetical protein
VTKKAEVITGNPLAKAAAKELSSSVAGLVSSVTDDGAKKPPSPPNQKTDSLKR